MTENTSIIPPRAAALVLNWNGADVIRDCLKSLRAYTHVPYRVLVVDNASTDESPAIIQEEFPECDFLPLQQNYGFAEGNNKGITYLQEKYPSLEYIALLNNDTRAQNGWLDALVESLDNHPHHGFAAAQLVCWNGKDTPTVIDSAGDVFYQHGLAGKRGHGKQINTYSEEEDAFGACAGAALYRCAMLKDIGLLDSDFFAYNEDVDLSFRAQLAGWKCRFVPKAVVWHRVSFSAKPFSPRVIYWAKRNSLWVIIKCMPLRLILRHILPIVGYNMLSDIRWFFGGRAGAVIKGRFAAILALPRMLRKRRLIMKNRKCSLKELDTWIIRETPWCETVRRNLKRFFGRAD